MPKRSLTILFALVLLTGGVLFHPPGYAQELDALVRDALAENPELAAAKARWEQSTFVAPQVGSLMDPVLGLSLSSYPYDTLSSDETPMTGNEVRISQLFPFPGKLANRSAQAEAQARWFEAVYLDKHYQVARKVKDAWYRLYLVGQSIKVVERNLALVDDVVRLAEVRYETGSGLQQDVLKAHVQRSKMTEKLLSLQQVQATIQAELSRLLSRSDVALAAPPNDLPQVEEVPSLEALQQAALERRPMNEAYRSLIQRYRHQKKLAELDDYPDVTLWGSWRFRDDDLPDGGTDFVSAGVSFNLPVYRDKRRAANAEALAAIRTAERQSQDFRDAVSESINKAYARMNESRQQSALYRSGIIPQANQSFQAALSAYQVGKVEFMSLLDALMAAYQAELDYYRVSTEYMRSLAALESESTLALTGAPIPLDAAATADLNQKDD